MNNVCLHSSASIIIPHIQIQFLSYYSSKIFETYKNFKFNSNPLIMLTDLFVCHRFIGCTFKGTLFQNTLKLLRIDKVFEVYRTYYVHLKHWCLVSSLELFGFNRAFICILITTFQICTNSFGVKTSKHWVVYVTCTFHDDEEPTCPLKEENFSDVSGTVLLQWL